jgi:hypothetical protein
MLLENYFLNETLKSNFMLKRSPHMIENTRGFLLTEICVVGVYRCLPGGEWEHTGPQPLES